MLYIKIKENIQNNNIYKKDINNIYDKVTKDYKKQGYDVSLYFTDDNEMKKLNNTYRNKNKTTDVLSFPYSDKEDNILGEIIISIPQAKRQSEEGFKKEILKLFTHGMLHLLGFEHNTDKKFKKMKNIEKKYLEDYEKK